MLLMLGLALGASAQDEEGGGPCDRPTDKKLVKTLQDAVGTKDPRERHAALKALLEAEPECTECLYQLGVSAYGRAKAGAGNFDAGIGYLEQVRDRCPEYHGDLYYYLGHMYYGKDRFSESAQAYQKFLKFSSDDPARASTDADAKVAEVEKVMPELQFYADFYRDTRALDPMVLRGVSTPADEYLPMFSPDNERLYFTRISKYQAKGDPFPRDVEELTESKRADVKLDLDKGAPLPSPFNTGDSYGGVTVSVNNKEMFVTICKPVSSDYKNCDIYRAHFDTHVDLESGKQVFEWSRLMPLGPEVNTADGWESQPTLSADGRTLYFATVRRTSRGTDIYQSTRNEKGEWSPAIPVPGPINTDGDEKAPFLHTDSHTMYFAAKPAKEAGAAGHLGIGGYDIFFSRMDDSGNWSKPKNIGNPINTPQDDHGLIVSADGRTAYFSSGRYKGVGGLDIYGFELPKEARPEDIMIVKGEVKGEDGEVVQDAEVSITYMDTRRTETIKVDNTDGRYATVVKLKAGADVVVTVKKPDHVFDSRVFTVEDTVRKGVAKVEMELAPIAVGKSYRVNDINYATSSATITKASEHILEQLIIFLKENPTVRIEIQGHTDNVGALDKNMALSNDRAFTVKAYLEGQGISSGRLASKGLGPTKPLADNGTEEGRARNRRTEFVITGR